MITENGMTGKGPTLVKIARMGHPESSMTQ
jgi:hypothetical protein